MRILHLIDSFGVYGAEILLINLMKQQVLSGHKPILLSFQSSDVEEDQSVVLFAKKAGLEALGIQNPNRFNPKLLREISDIIADHDIEILHSHGYKPNILISFLFIYGIKIKKISTVHGWIKTSLFSRIWIYRLLDYFSLKLMDAVVNVNSELPVIKCKKGTFVIENGISEIEFDNHYVKNHHIDDHNFLSEGYIIGNISRLSPEKGLDILIKVIFEVIKIRKDVKLVLIGEGSEREKLENLVITLNLQNSVLIAGYRKNAFQYLKYFNLFCLPSLSEGLPITLLESMQAGVPIVASRVGGIAKLLGDGVYGSLIEPNDQTQLKSSILDVYDNRDYYIEKAMNSKKVIKENYSVEAMSRNYDSVYETILIG